MYWQEEEEQDGRFVVPESVVDLHFKIRCDALPVDHGWLLFDALSGHLPWLEEETQAGIHAIHGGESGNGWERPEERDALIYPSRRTPLVLRLPRHRVEAARALEGVELQLPSGSLHIGPSSKRPLHKAATLHARHLAYENVADEEQFIARAVADLRAFGIGFKKVLCGRRPALRNRNEDVETRSLMVADLSFADSVRLQELGLGPFRHLGCGLFIPHKSV